MRISGDFNTHDDPEGDTTLDHPAEWLDRTQDELADSSETDLGEGGYLRPWKTTDI